MTKHESEILTYLKLNSSAIREDILNNFKDRTCGELSVIRTDDRIRILDELNYIRHPVPNSSDYVITPAGLHALDEYLENQTRLDKAESNANKALMLSYISAAISFVGLIISVSIK